MKIAEPMTLLTDYVLTFCGVFWGLRLLRHGRATGQRAVGWWAVGFFAIAIGSFVGGTWHGFLPMLAERPAAAMWKVTLFAAGGVGFAILAATFFAHVGPTLRRVLIAVAAVKLAVYCAWMATHSDFIWVIADYGSSMVVALVLHAIAWWRRGDPGAPWIVAAIVVSFVGAGVQASGFALHRHFNHNDLYHVIQVLGLYLFQRGAWLARDRESSGASPVRLHEPT
jgi:hypothetical protein